MGSPYDMEFTVTAEKAPFCFEKRWYKAGEKIMMSRTDYLACQKTQIPADELPCGFPEYGKKTDKQTAGYRADWTIPPGEVVVIPVASIEGHRPPRIVQLRFKGCIRVGYNADPVVGATDGTSADCPCDKDCRELVDKYGNCIETLHVMTTDEEPVELCLSYYC